MRFTEALRHDSMYQREGGRGGGRGGAGGSQQSVTLDMLGGLYYIQGWGWG